MESIVSKRLVIVSLGITAYACFAAAWLLIVAGIHFSNRLYLVAGASALLGFPVFAALGYIVEAAIKYLENGKFSANENSTDINK